MNLKQVEEFWNENLCGSHFISLDYLSKEFFDEYRKFRYRKTHHLNTYIDWQGARGKDVLEIGLGIGADGCRWAGFANSYTGIDLTTEAVSATIAHFHHLNLKGNIQKGNAENLNFSNESFDIVYSHGVLHHTPNIEKAFSEIYRVLKKDGEFILMLYAKNSFNYWVRIQLYFRARLLIKIIGDKLSHNFFNRKVSSHKDIWDNHLDNFKKIGWKYLSWNAFPHRCTDGPNCEIANCYTKNDASKLLESNGFAVKKTKKAHFPVGGGGDLDWNRP